MKEDDPFLRTLRCTGDRAPFYGLKGKELDFKDMRIRTTAKGGPGSPPSRTQSEHSGGKIRYVYCDACRTIVVDAWDARRKRRSWGITYLDPKTLGADVGPRPRVAVPRWPSHLMG